MLAVLTAADGAAWEATLLAELSAGSGGLTVARRCVDVVELVAVGASGQAVAALVDAQLRQLDTDAVERLLAAGVAVVGVTAAGSMADAERLVECGISFSVPADAAAAVFGTVVQTAVAELAGLESSSYSRAFADPAAAAVALHRAAEGTADISSTSTNGRRGSVIAVWGPTGAPGRTTVAANLADELARLGVSTLLIDADVYGGVTASVFGLLDDSPGLVAACRQAQSRRLDPAMLSGLCWQLGPKLRVLTGIARADRWPELRPGAIGNVLEIARGLVDFAVLDLGFGLETDEELSFDTIAPRRNGATLAALDDADLVLVVGSADPIGMQRLVRGLAELRSTEIQAPSWVVLNRVRRTAVPGSPETELAVALKRFAGRSPAALLPHDLEAMDRAILAGKSLAEASPNSPLRRAILELACAVSGVAVPERGRRRKHSGDGSKVGGKPARGRP